VAGTESGYGPHPGGHGSFLRPALHQEGMAWAAMMDQGHRLETVDRAGVHVGGDRLIYIYTDTCFTGFAEALSRKR
jgi:hypothetical protein